MINVKASNNAIYSSLLLLLFIESFVLFYLAPDHYSYEFNLFCFIQYILSSFLFFSYKRKTNYFDFDTVFLFLFFITHFIYPIFIYKTGNESRFFAYNFETNYDVVSKGTALALLGIQSYMMGSLLRYKAPKVSQLPYKPNGLMTIMIVIVVLAFVSLGGIEMYDNLYKGIKSESLGILSYLALLVIALVLPSFVIEFNNLNDIYKGRSIIRKSNLILWIISFLFVFMIFMTGSRTMPLSICLTIVGLYTIFVSNISFKRFLLLAFFGFFLMYGILVLRKSVNFNDFKIIDMFTDLILPGRNTYLAIDYVDENGITYGKSMLTTLLAVVPFLSSFVHNLFNISIYDTASSFIFTIMSLGDSSNLYVGFGTNTVADLYIAFGITGVVIGFMILGFLINFMLSNSMSNIYCLVGYIVLLSYSAYIVRAEYFVFLRLLVWSIFMIYLIKRSKTINYFNKDKNT